MVKLGGCVVSSSKMMGDGREVLRISRVSAMFRGLQRFALMGLKPVVAIKRAQGKHVVREIVREGHRRCFRKALLCCPLTCSSCRRHFPMASKASRAFQVSLPTLVPI
jgi:hypothetical protein